MTHVSGQNENNECQLTQANIDVINMETDTYVYNNTITVGRKRTLSPSVLQVCLSVCPARHPSTIYLDTDLIR